MMVVDTSPVQHLYTSQYAEAAVELAAGGLGVDMAAGHHRRQGGVAPWAAGEDIADAIDRHGAAGLLAPAHEQVAGLAVEVGQGQAADPAFDGGPELRQLRARLETARLEVEKARAGHLPTLDGK